MTIIWRGKGLKEVGINKKPKINFWLFLETTISIKTGVGCSRDKPEQINNYNHH